MPPLIQKWNELKDEDKDLFPLLEVRTVSLEDELKAILNTVPCIAHGNIFVKTLSLSRSLVPLFSGHGSAEWLPALL